MNVSRWSFETQSADGISVLILKCDVRALYLYHVHMRQRICHKIEETLINYDYIPLSAVIDGVDTSSMTRDQLEKFSHNLKNEVEKEREERNYFQNERDQLRTFWEITKNQLGMYKSINRPFYYQPFI